MDVGRIFATLFVAAVGFGALVMIVDKPAQSNAAAGAGADTIIGVTKAFEGRG